MSISVERTRRIDVLLAEYGESHQNPTNKTIHWIAVPVIAWSVIAILWALPTPGFFPANLYVNWATIGRLENERIASMASRISSM